jgi:hypothetical protein
MRWSEMGRTWKEYVAAYFKMVTPFERVMKNNLTMARLWTEIQTQDFLHTEQK